MSSPKHWTTSRMGGGVSESFTTSIKNVMCTLQQTIYIMSNSAASIHFFFLQTSPSFLYFILVGSLINLNKHQRVHGTVL